MARVSTNERIAIRGRLLEAAKGEFAARGLAGARFDEISLSAGCAKGTIYNYFESKEALFFTIVHEWCDLLSEAFNVLSAPTATERLRQIANLDVEVARKDPDLARVVVQHMPALTGQHADAVGEAIKQGLGLLEEVFQEGIEGGEFESDCTPSTLARLFLATLSAFELEALTPGPAIGLDDVVDLLDKHFLYGLRPKETKWSDRN